MPAEHPVSRLLAEHEQRLLADQKAAELGREAIDAIIYPVFEEFAAELRKAHHGASALRPQDHDPHFTSLTIEIHPNLSAARTGTLRVECTTKGIVRYGTVAGNKFRFEKDVAVKEAPITDEWIRERTIIFIREVLATVG
jgi:hypothetical protein